MINEFGTFQGFQAQGATFDGRHLACYPQLIRRQRGDDVAALKCWSGNTLAELRFFEVGDYETDFWGSCSAIVFRTGRRDTFIGGLLLGDGNLFRGEIIHADDDKDATYQAREIAQWWLRIDEEDQEAFLAQLDDDDRIEIDFTDEADDYIELTEADFID